MPTGDPLGSPSPEEFRSQNRWLIASACLNAVLTALVLYLLVSR